MTAWQEQAIQGAQDIYDAWDQDENGHDEEFGGGGICDAIADALAGALTEHGFDAFTYHYSDDNHTVAIALMDGGTFEVNIPLSLYERGSYYSYTKIPGRVFEIDDIVLTRLGGPEVYEELNDE